VQLINLGFPRRFPIIQFPNLPLVVAFVTGWSSRTAAGASHDYLVSIAYLAMTVWAYEELAHGINWFRRLLGLWFAIVMDMRVVHAMGG
jgi:hypothetical protein